MDECIDLQNKLQYDHPLLVRSYKGEKFELQIIKHGSHALLVTLVNTNYPKQLSALIKHLFTFLTILLMFMLMKFYKIILVKCIILEILLSIYALLLFWNVKKLTKAEKFLYCHNFGIHLQSHTFLGKSNLFIESVLIHDIVINEVLENFGFHYLLIVRTMGYLFLTKPIIPVFKNLKPSVDCLEIIYQHMQKILNK